LIGLTLIDQGGVEVEENGADGLAHLPIVPQRTRSSAGPPIHAAAQPIGSALEQCRPPLREVAGLLVDSNEFASAGMPTHDVEVGTAYAQGLGQGLQHGIRRPAVNGGLGNRDDESGRVTVGTTHPGPRCPRLDPNGVGAHPPIVGTNLCRVCTRAQASGRNPARPCTLGEGDTDTPVGWTFVFRSMSQ